MSPSAISVLAFGMSVDAFAAALGRGAIGPRIRIQEALRTGAVFGAVEAAMPLLGWTIGLVAAERIAAYDHWVAFILLGLVGLHVLFGALRRDSMTPPPVRSPWVLLAIALGTSIDALAVGVSLAVLDANIWVIAPAIGAATFLMASAGMLTGRMLGARIGQVAEALAGVALILLGTSILIEHLGA